jgi:hypothetical protein
MEIKGFLDDFMIPGPLSGLFVAFLRRPFRFFASTLPPLDASLVPTAR